MSMNRRNVILGAAALIGVAGAGYLLIQDDPGTATYFAEEGIALRGADSVAYFTEQKAVIGTPAFTHDWQGVTWHFSNAAHRDLFAETPDAYAPQYGGYCAWAVAAKQKLFSIQPDNWTVREGKLYLNFSDGVQAKWAKDPAGFIKSADDVWPDVSKALE